MTKTILKGFDIIVSNKYEEDDYEMYAVVAKNKKQAKIIVLRYKERASLGATRKRKYTVSIEDGPYNLDERNLKNKLGFIKQVGG